MCGRRRRRIVTATSKTVRRGSEGSFPVELAVVWALFAWVTVEILVTYSRLPPGELYHVSGSGLIGGSSRALVFLNFPVALVAIPMLALLAGRLSSRPASVVAPIGIGLAAAVFWPGIVKQSDLDARPANAIPALGVLVALTLTLVAGRALARPRRPVHQPGDRLRLLVAVAAVALALPWIAADLGVFLNGVPVLGSLYETGELRAEPGASGLHPAVHHGHHHGMDGVLLVLSALLLSRLVPSLPRGWRRGLLGGYLALMLCYGAGNAANDFWFEQVVKRGWTQWQIPDVTTPKASAAWGVIVLAASTLWAIAAWCADRTSTATAAS